jgi:hypothetical protein
MEVEKESAGSFPSVGTKERERAFNGVWAAPYIPEPLRSLKSCQGNPDQLFWNKVMETESQKGQDLKEQPTSLVGRDLSPGLVPLLEAQHPGLSAL